MRLIAIDTATELCSVALYVDGKVRERAARQPRAHADHVLPFVSALLSEAELSLAQLDGLAFGRGPGGFTGLRIAAAVVQGLAFGADLPVAGISDLAATAWGAFEARGWTSVVACLDARMSEVYYGAFRCDEAGAIAVSDEALATPGELVAPPGMTEWQPAGPGWPAYAGQFAETVRTHLNDVHAEPPQARAVAMLGAKALAAGQGGAPEEAIPVYIRDRVAEKPRKG